MVEMSKGPDESEPNVQDQVLELVSVGRDLVSKIERLTDDRGNQLVTLTKKTVWNRKAIMVIGASILVDVLVTAAVGMSQFQLNSNADRIDALTKRLDVSQTTTRQQVLCPLYQLFKDSESPEGRKRSPNPEQYDRSFEVIREGYEVLECQVYINSSPSPPSPLETP